MGEPAAGPVASRRPAGGGAVRWVRRGLTIAAIVAVGVALRDAVRDAGEVPVPQPGALGLAAVLLAVALLCAGLAWSVLLPSCRTRDLLPGFLLAQLARYVPGSVWQGVSQVLEAERLGVARGAASVAFLVQLGTQLVSVTVLGGLVVLGGVAPPVWWVGAAAPVSLVLLWRPVLAAGLRLLARVAPRRLGHLPQTLPAQGRIVAAAGLGLLTAAGLAAAYLVLLPVPPEAGEVLAAPSAAVIGAFAAAWVVGFLVVPLPAGMGVRELVLVLALGPAVGTAPVLAAAVVHRVVAIATEALIALIARVTGVIAGRTAPPGRTA